MRWNGFPQNAGGVTRGSREGAVVYGPRGSRDLLSPSTERSVFAAPPRLDEDGPAVFRLDLLLEQDSPCSTASGRRAARDIDVHGQDLVDALHTL